MNSLLEKLRAKEIDLDKIIEDARPTELPESMLPLISGGFYFNPYPESSSASLASDSANNNSPPQVIDTRTVNNHNGTITIYTWYSDGSQTFQICRSNGSNCGPLNYNPPPKKG